MTEKTNAQTETLEAKLERATAYVAKLQAAIVARDIVNDVQVGDAISFKYGRAERTRLLDGVVLATLVGTQQAIVLVDGKPYTIPFQTITANVTKEARSGSVEAVTGEGEANVADLPEPVEVDADPLLQA